MSDINWAGLNNRRNIFADLTDGLQHGAAMRKDRQAAEQEAAQKQAYNLFATDPAGAEKALMAAGDLRGAEAMRSRREDEGQRFRRGMVGMMVGKGDMKGAQAKAVQVGEYDLAANIGKMDEQQRKAARDNAEDLGGFAQALLGVPYEQRRAVLAQAKETLVGYGLKPEAVDAFDPTDDQLRAQAMSAMDLKTALEEAARQRDDARADQALAETKRSNTVRERQGDRRIGLSADANRRGWASFNERKKAGGFGTPGVGGVIPDDDVEIDP